MNPRVLKNFGVFVDGRGYLGRAEEVQLPSLTIKTEEFRAGGRDIPLEIDMGMEAMETKFISAEFDQELWKEFGIDDGLKTRIVVRGALRRDPDEAIPLVATLHGAIKQIEMEAFKSGERNNATFTMATRYYRLEIEDEEVFEIDVDNMKRVIRGVDQMESIRATIGM